MKNQHLNALSNKIDGLKFKQILLILLGTISAALSVVFAFLIEGLVDAVVNNNGLTLKVINAVIVAVLIFISSALVNFLAEKYKIDAEKSIKNYVVKGYVEKAYVNGELLTGDVVTRLESEAVAFSSSVMTVVPKIVTSVIRLVLILVGIFVINAIFGLVVAIAGVIIVLVTVVVRRVTVKLYKKTREENANVSSYLTEVDENLLAVKGLRAESVVESRYDKELTSYAKAKKSQYYFQAGFSSLIPFAFNLAFLLAVLLSKEYVFGIVAIVQLIMQARTPITSFASLIATYYEMGVSATRLVGLTGNAETYTAVDGEFDKLEVNNVNFSYENESVIKDFSLTVNKGERVVIKGETGVGKTTLLKLLTGIYKPTNGVVSYVYNGVGYDANSVKNAFSVAYQGHLIFSGTVKDNLTLSNPTATDEEISSAINFAVLGDVVSQVGLSGIIGERGTTLSEGQNQRLAIARAVLSNAGVIILDEPTSALDEKTKAELLNNIASSNKTFIIVTHDSEVEKLASKVVEIK